MNVTHNITNLVTNNLTQHIEVLPSFFKMLFTSSITLNLFLVYRFELLTYINILMTILRGYSVE
mgnify:FL=1